MARLFILGGVGLVAVGVLLKMGVPLGRLPGDLIVRRGSFTLYVPLATSIVASLVLTALMTWWSRR